MKKRSRLLLFLLACGVFLAVTPLVVLYALGYRLSVPGTNSRSVGVVLLGSTPSRADVRVNGQLAGRTPHAIPDLLAGSVDIKVERFGYQPWEKQLEVLAGRATEVRDIRLFPNTLEPRVVVPDVDSFTLSPNRRLFAAIHKDHTLAVYDEFGLQLTTPLVLPTAVTQMRWSPDNASLIITPSGRTPLVLIVRTDTQYQLPLAIDALEVAWDPVAPSRLLVLTHNQLLMAFNVDTKSSQTLLHNISTFAVSARHIYAITATNALATYTLQGTLIATSSIAPNDVDIVQLLVTPAGAVAFITSDHQLHYLDQRGQRQLVSSVVESAIWSPSGDMLAVVTDSHSIHVYNVSDDRWLVSQHELQLVTRLSRAVSHVQWFAGGRHLIYQVVDEIHVIEIDTRDHPIDVQLDTTNTGNAQAAVGEDGSQLFYLRETDNSANVVVAALDQPAITK